MKANTRPNQIVKEVKSSGALDGYAILAQAVVEQTDKGKVKVHEPGRGGVALPSAWWAVACWRSSAGPVGVLAMAAAVVS